MPHASAPGTCSLRPPGRPGSCTRWRTPCPAPVTMRDHGLGRSAKTLRTQVYNSCSCLSPLPLVSAVPSPGWLLLHKGKLPTNMELSLPCIACSSYSFTQLEACRERLALSPPVGDGPSIRLQLSLGWTPSMHRELPTAQSHPFCSNTALIERIFHIIKLRRTSLELPPAGPALGD